VGMSDGCWARGRGRARQPANGVLGESSATASPLLSSAQSPDYVATSTELTSSRRRRLRSSLATDRSFCCRWSMSYSRCPIA